MSMFSDIFGTMRNSFRIGGLAGVRLVHQGGNLQIRDGGDTAYQNLHCNSLNLETALPVLEGGTGATTAADARTNLGAAANAYSSSVSGFTPTTVAAALDALAGVRISASASNANGIYYRWENGLQICIFNNIAAAFVNASIIDGAWTFPAAFNAIPTTIPGVRTLTSAAVAFTEVGMFQIAAVSSTATTYRLYAPAGGDSFASGDTAVFHGVAVGTWK